MQDNKSLSSINKSQIHKSQTNQFLIKIDAVYSSYNMAQQNC